MARDFLELVVRSLAASGRLLAGDGAATGRASAAAQVSSAMS